jgi:hypothetical protein
MAAPIKTFKDGGTEVAIWEREYAGGTFNTVSMSRSYKDKKTDEWKRSSSFSESQLEKLIPLLREAQDFMKSGGIPVPPAQVIPDEEVPF